MLCGVHSGETMPTIDERALAGREQDIATLRSLIAGVIAGRGAFALLSGEQGIGKSTLLGRCTAMARAEGLRVLSALSDPAHEATPYGLWTELFEPVCEHPAARDACDLLHISQPPVAGRSPRHLAHAIAGALTGLAAEQPLVLLLDDLHLADDSSLDVLIPVAQRLEGQPVLLIAAYRDDVARQHERFSHYLVTLLRMMQPLRIPLRRLDGAALSSLVANRHPLSPRDQRRLRDYLAEHSQGNPLLATELLYTLEAEGLLQPGVANGGREWALIELPRRLVPPLVRDLVTRRLANLPDDVRRALYIAAVIGHQIDLDIWQSITALPDDDMAEIIEAAGEHGVLHESPRGLAFAHPTLRDVLYDDLVVVRRRRVHRLIAEYSAKRGHPDPHVVAYHFSQANDPQAISWLVRAGLHAERSYAWLMASERYETALAMLDATTPADADAEGASAAWLLYRLALLNRYAEPQRALRYLTEGIQVAAETGEQGLAAGMRHHHGLLRCWTDDISGGMAELEQSVAEIERLSDAEYAALNGIAVFGERAAGEHRGTLVDWYCNLGRFAEAIGTHSSDVIQPPAQPNGTQPVRISPAGDRLSGLAGAFAHSAQPERAREIYATARRYFDEFGHHHALGWMYLEELRYVGISFETEDIARLNALAEGAVAAWERSSPALLDMYPRLALLPLLYLRGEWTEARQLGQLARTMVPGHESYLDARPILAAIALHSGERTIQQAFCDELLPCGLETPPGTALFTDAMDVQRLNARAALLDGDLDLAGRWIAAHERWLEWSGARRYAPGLALLRSQHARRSGAIDMAWEQAQRALEQATTHGQPLDILVAQRQLGTLAVEAGEFAEATTYLTAALERAGRVSSPLEQARTLLAIAGLRDYEQRQHEAAEALDHARLIAVRLGASAIVEQVNRATVELAGDDQLTDGTARLARLTPREIDILQRLVAGATTREIAYDINVSVRTVERHISNLYDKIGVEQRSQAISFALRHGLGAPSVAETT
jgi:DNA-binding NarL/FixJ family response regulator